MITPKLAFRNLIGAGLRTWLSVIVLSISYVIIIWQNGILDGWNKQALTDMTNWEVAGGQYWQKNYNPFDTFTLVESSSQIPLEFASLPNKAIAPILITQATIYPQGRMQNALLKGISPEQNILKIPTDTLAEESDEIPVLIGTRMAKNANLKSGDSFVIRWRDSNGTFDAADAKVVAIMKTNVSNIDQGQIWLPLKRLQKMLQLPGFATIIVMSKDAPNVSPQKDWNFKSPEFLTQDHKAMIEMKKISGGIMYAIFLSLALLVIFDTQVLSIFKRRKEIGTLIALGMTRFGVVKLFTLEGAMHGILAALVAALYGIPLLGYSAKVGFSMPEATDNFGLTIAEKIFPIYSIGLVAGTTFIIMISVTIVSFLPARKISQMNPTEAIRGKVS